MRNLQTVNTITVSASRDLALTDVGLLLAVSSVSTIVLTVRLQSAVPWSTQANCFIERHGTGVVQITAESGVTLNGVSGGSFEISTQYSGAWLRRLSTNTWILVGSGFLSVSDIGNAAGQVAPAKLPSVSVTGTSKTLALSDAESLQVCNNAATQTITIPTQAAVAWEADTQTMFLRWGAGAVAIVGDTGVSVNGVSAGSKTISAQYRTAYLRRIGSDDWFVGGEVV